MSIIEVILYIVVGFFELILNFVPTFSLPDSAISSLNALFDLIATIGFFMPLQTLAQVLVLGVAFYFIEFLLAFLQFFFGKIPFLNIR